MNQFLIAILAFLLFQSIHFTQPAEKPEIAISTAGSPRILVGINNLIVIVAQQAKPVYRNQISLRFEHPNPDSSSRAVLTGDKGHFRLQVDTTGVLILSIKTEQGIVEKKLRCVALDVVTRFGGLNKSGKMNSAVFKAQGGIIASIECCDITAQCKVIDYEILKFNARGMVFRGGNTGGPLMRPSAPSSIEPGRATFIGFETFGIVVQGGYSLVLHRKLLWRLSKNRTKDL